MYCNYNTGCWLRPCCAWGGGGAGAGGRAAERQSESSSGSVHKQATAYCSSQAFHSTGELQ
jgi:hypothetical protein